MVYQKRFIEGEWKDDKAVIDFLVERIFQLQVRIQDLESLSKIQANPKDLSANKDFTATKSPKEKINALLCCDCKSELVDNDDFDKEARKSIRCPECWAKMEEEVNLED